MERGVSCIGKMQLQMSLTQLTRASVETLPIYRAACCGYELVPTRHNVYVYTSARYYPIAVVRLHVRNAIISRMHAIEIFMTSRARLFTSIQRRRVEIRVNCQLTFLTALFLKITGVPCLHFVVSDVKIILISLKIVST